MPPEIGSETEDCCPVVLDCGTGAGFDVIVPVEVVVDTTIDSVAVVRTVEEDRLVVIAVVAVDSSEVAWPSSLTLLCLLDGNVRFRTVVFPFTVPSNAADDSGSDDDANPSVARLESAQALTSKLKIAKTNQ